MNIAALRKRLAEIKSKATSILDAADSAGGDLTAEQATKFDGLMAERASVEANIKRLEQLESMNASAGRSVKPAEPMKALGVEVHDRSEDDPMRGFKSAAEFGLCVLKACIPNGQRDERLSFDKGDGSPITILGAPSNFHKETGSADGYMVPPQVREEVWSLVQNQEGLLSKVRPEPTSSNSVELLVDDSTNYSATGVQAAWLAEGAQFTPTRLNTAARNVKLHKIGAFVLGTDELLSDAPRLQNRLTVGAAGAIGWAIDEAIVNGNGVARPLGWHNAANGSLVVVAKEDSQAATTIVAKNVLKMRSRLLGPARGAFWIANSDTLPQLAVMTIGDQPMWAQAPAGLRDMPTDRLLGLPLYWSEHAQTLGTQGDIQLVAPEGYYSAVKGGGLKFAASMHLYFDYDIEAFRWTFRVAGQPVLNAAISPAKGSNTKSHTITLAVRA